MAFERAVDDVAPRIIPWPSAALAWWTIACIVLAAFMCTMDRLVLNLLVDPIKSDLGITETQFSLLQGVSFNAINSIAAFPLGFLTDKKSRRNLLIFGILVWSLATTLGGLSANYGQFLTARIFVGMGEAALWPVSVSLIADLLPACQRGRAVSLVLLGQILGSGASLILTGWILKLAPTGFFDFIPLFQNLSPWRIVLVMWGFLGAVVIAMLLTAREPVRRAAQRSELDAGSLRAFFRHIGRQKRIMLPIYLSACMVSIASYSLAAWTPSYFIRHFGRSPSSMGPILGSVVILWGICGTTIAGFLSDRAEKSGRRDLKYTLSVGAALCGLVVTTLVFIPNMGIGVAVQGLSLLFFPIVAITHTVIIQDLVPNEMRGKAQVFLTLSGALGATLGPTFTAMVTQYVYGNDNMVGYSLTTILTPAILICAASTYFARRAFIRQGGQIEVGLTRAALPA